MPQAVKAVQTLLLSHVPTPHSAVQVDIPVVPTVFFGVAIAHPPVAKRVVVADVQVYVTLVAAAPVMGVHAVQTLLLSHVPTPHSAVQVDIPVVPTVFFGVAVAHPPVAKRVVVSDVQVYVGPAFELKVVSAPSMAVHA